MHRKSMAQLEECWRVIGSLLRGDGGLHTQIGRTREHEYQTTEHGRSPLFVATTAVAHKSAAQDCAPSCAAQ